jgi:hypothetical protein
MHLTVAAKEMFRFSTDFSEVHENPPGGSRMMTVPGTLRENANAPKTAKCVIKIYEMWLWNNEAARVALPKANLRYFLLVFIMGTFI